MLVISRFFVCCFCCCFLSPSPHTFNCWTVQCSSRRYLFARKSLIISCAPPCLSEVSQCHLWNCSNVRLIDNSPLSSFQGRSSNASSFHAPLFPVIDGVMDVLVFVPASSVSSSSTLQIFLELVWVALPASLSAW